MWSAKKPKIVISVLVHQTVTFSRTIHNGSTAVEIQLWHADGRWENFGMQQIFKVLNLTPPKGGGLIPDGRHVGFTWSFNYGDLKSFVHLPMPRSN